MRIKSKGASSRLFILLLACSAGTASAQLAIPRFTVAGGGGGSAGGAFALSGTAGQLDAGRMAGASFVLTGGFWAGGGGIVLGVSEGHEDGVSDPSALPRVFQLLPARPNPVQESMVLVFDLPEASFVRTEIYDVAGRLVRVLASEVVAAGRNQRVWDRRDHDGLLVPAGIYYVRFDAASYRSCQKVVVVS